VARNWATLCFSNEAPDDCSTLVRLLPRVGWPGGTARQRYKDISTMGDAVMDAAAIHLGKFDLALEWLKPRSIHCMGTNASASHENLRQHYPHEADELVRTEVCRYGPEPRSLRHRHVRSRTGSSSPCRLV
jgi:hypothetical protein